MSGVARNARRGGTGKEALWRTFGLSYATWLVLPRLFMHAMPDEWQGRMAKLIDEFQETFDPWDDCDPHVSFKRGGKFVPLPEWSDRHNYRHPNAELIESKRRPTPAPPNRALATKPKGEDHG